MKIVVLDALPLDADIDMDWSPLRALGELTLYPQTAPEETAARIADATVVFTNKVRLTADHFAAAPNLRLVSVLATGHDIVDSAAAREQSVTVCNVPGYSTPSTAQTTVALLLELCHHVGDHARRVRAGAWTDAGIWSYWETTPVELAGLRMLLIGRGAIGTQVGYVAAALGMTVQAAQLPGREAKAGTEYIPLDIGLAEVDVVSLPLPADPGNARTDEPGTPGANETGRIPCQHRAGRPDRRNRRRRQPAGRASRRLRGGRTERRTAST